MRVNHVPLAKREAMNVSTRTERFLGRWCERRAPVRMQCTKEPSKGAARGRGSRDPATKASKRIQSVQERARAPDEEFVPIRLKAAEAKIAQGSYSSSRPDHSSGCHHLIVDWPKMNSLLYKCSMPIDSGYVMKAESENRPEKRRKGDNGGFYLAPIPHADTDRVGVQPYMHKTRHTTPDEPRGLLALVQSYAEHLHPMHPIVNLDHIINLLNDDSLGWKVQQSFSSDDYQVEEYEVPDHSPAKRRRISRQAADEEELLAEPYESVESVKPKLDTALVHLILALGEICAFKSTSKHIKLSAIETSLRENDQYRSNTTSTMHSPISAASSQMYFSSGSSPTSKRSRQPNGNAGGGQESIIPGMQYHNLATQAFRSQKDGDSLMHAQVAVLAALYEGQLGRPRDSMDWIAIASRIVQDLLLKHNLLESEDPPVDDDLREPQRRMQERMREMQGEDERANRLPHSTHCLDLHSIRERYSGGAAISINWTYRVRESNAVATSSFPSAHSEPRVSQWTINGGLSQEK